MLPKAAEIDREHRHPNELVARMAELGLLGVAVPEQWGGAGMDTVVYVLAMEEISRACASTGVIMSVNNSLVCDPMLKFGTDEQKQELLAPLAAGKLLGCFALVRARGRLRRRGAEDRGPAGRRRLRHQRHQELDHQRPGRRRRASCSR